MPARWNIDGTPVIMQDDGSQDAYDERHAQWQKPSGQYHTDAVPVTIDPRLVDPPAIGQNSGGVNDVKYGRTITVYYDTSVAGNNQYDGIINQRINAIWTPAEHKQCPWTISILIDGAFPSQEGEVFGARIRWMVGGAYYQSTIILAGLGMTASAIKRFPIMARKVEVDVFWMSPVLIDPPNLPVKFTVGVEKGEINSQLFLSPAWVSGYGMSGVPANIYQIFPPPLAPAVNDIAFTKGVIISMVGVLTAPVTAGAVPLYPMAFDAPNLAGVTPGLRPIPGTVGPPVTNAGDSFAFSDEEDPQCGFQQGLTVALSSDPRFYVAPGAGATYAVDVKVGQ